LIPNTARHRGQLGDDRRPYGSELSVLTGNLLVAKPRTASEPGLPIDRAEVAYPTEPVIMRESMR
jgi:hypothetical protein